MSQPSLRDGAALPREALGLGLRPAFIRGLLASATKTTTTTPSPTPSAASSPTTTVASSAAAPSTTVTPVASRQGDERAQSGAIVGAVGAVGFVELIAENVLGRSDLPRRRLAELRSTYPATMHCVSLNLLGSDPLDVDFLRRLRALCDEHAIDVVSDHLSFSASGGAPLHDLLPSPLSRALVPYAVDRIRAVQDILGRRFAVENPSTYVRYVDDDIDESAFLAAVVDGADCDVVLDINNIFVASVNHGFDPRAFFDDVPWQRVAYVHMAGHLTRADGLRHDTHDRAVDDDVWGLYAEAWRRGGPFPTLLEWDDQLPPFDDAVSELQRAITARGGVANTPRGMT